VDDVSMKRLVVVAASALLIGCSSGAQLVIVNDSDVRLLAVVATVEGRSTQIGSREAHSQQQGTVYPRGESGGVRLTFRAGDKPVTSEQQIYFEDGYRVIVTVSPQLQLSAEIGRY
jgi:hypothetical protein